MLVFVKFHAVSREASSGNKGHVQDNQIPTGVEAITLHVPIFGSQFKYS